MILSEYLSSDNIFKSSQIWSRSYKSASQSSHDGRHRNSLQHERLTDVISAFGDYYALILRMISSCLLFSVALFWSRHLCWWIRSDQLERLLRATPFREKGGLAEERQTAESGRGLVARNRLWLVIYDEFTQ